jgi:transcription elongation factor Elf1
MHQLTPTQISCPYCGEPTLVMIEAIGEAQEYTEDCQVCCRPMVFHVNEDHQGNIHVNVRAEDESIIG